MTLVNKGRLVSHYRIVDENLLSIISLVDTYGGIFIYSLESSVEETLAFFSRYSQDHPKKYLDFFIIILPNRAQDSCRFWQDFFDYFSSTYEEIISVENNVDNIKNLYNFISEYAQLDTSSNILDFACGTGLSVDVVENINLVGVDISEKMLAIAESRGLSIIGMDDLKKQVNYYDGIFSSYSFHFCIDEETLSIIWKSLKIGAPLVVNYHKGIGVHQVNEFIAKRNGMVVDVSKTVNFKHGLCYVYIKTSPFILFEDAKKMLVHELSLSINYVEDLIKYRILTVFIEKEKSGVENKYVLCSDLNIIKQVLNRPDRQEPDALVNKVASSTDKSFPDVYPLVKNLFCSHTEYNESIDDSMHYSRYLKRKNAIETAKKTQFARSAYYMGSKVKLRTFIIESLSSLHLSEDILIDLMTGSGAVAGVFSNFSKTIASDAMQFPKFLSTIQGGGYTKVFAINAINDIRKEYEKHYNDMKTDYQELMLKEDEFLKIDDTNEALNKYIDYLKSSHFYSTLNEQSIKKISERKISPTKYPYILVTEYFANIFFGVNQSVQIDSLRYAIDSLNDERDKRWALGALISTCSRIASSHANHFAQPAVIIDKEQNIKYKNIKKILFQRKMSLWREFEATFLSLAEESEKSCYPILFYDGPWHEAIERIELDADIVKPIVYIDAPYKREEYSRYYHVLETIVKYNYPSTVGKGKMPSKKEGERFQSAFFTKTKQKVENEFIKIISTILKKGWYCAWSYSDNGMASIINVVNDVANEVVCSVVPYSTPYSHKSQNGMRKTKNVEEYLILFKPK